MACMRIKNNFAVMYYHITTHVVPLRSFTTFRRNFGQSIVYLSR